VQSRSLNSLQQTINDNHMSGTKLVTIHVTNTVTVNGWKKVYDWNESF